MIRDAADQRPLRDAIVTIYGKKKGKLSVTSKHDGHAQFSGLCLETYHYTILHAGCPPAKGSFQLNGDTTIVIYLSHVNLVLPEVTVTNSKIELEHMSLQRIKASVFEQNQFKPLSEIMTAIPGVTVLRTGGQISKPVIRGMNSQRLAVLNHGMPQAGQQWGNDHAPEVSSFIYDSTSVIRGIASVEYPSGHMGGALVADKKASFTDEHLHGTLHTGYFSNGNGLWNHLKLEKADPQGGGFRADVAYKSAGDLKAPDHYLRNTGVREFSAGILWKYNYSKKVSNTFNYNYFKTTIGILRGAHIGNVSDLEEALQRTRPFFTEDRFIYSIDLPRQEVAHHTINNTTEFKLSRGSLFRLRLGFQHNDRNEFDFRRSGENERPSLSLVQNDFYADGIFVRKSQKSGIQVRITDNTNNPETGILPLIPDYLSHRIGLFYSADLKLSGRSATIGARYDLVHIQAFPVLRSIPLTVLEENRFFHKVTTNLIYPVVNTRNILMTWEGQLTTRAPDVNELYSFGLHQGVAGIEEGNRNLKNEFGIQHHLNSLLYYNQITVRADAYAYLFRNFINLEPTGELRSTIRGAFPVFAYNQYRLALMTGIDGLIEIEMTKSLHLEVKNSILCAQNIVEGIPLAWMPANRADAGFRITLPDFGKVKMTEWRISSLFVARQRRLLPDQDFMPPPPGYILFNSVLSLGVPVSKNILQISIAVENLFNRPYRDFLNRWKYFSDDIGRNIILSVRYSF